MEQLFKVLGDSNRLRLINLLMNAELCVCEIEILLDLSQSNASRHLKKLRDQQIIIASKDAQWIHYRINQEFIEQSRGLMEYLSGHFTDEAVYLQDLLKLKKYRQNDLNCSVIRDDRDRVIALIQGEKT